jgi:hypothetical protein
MVKAWLRRQITDYELVLNTEHDVYGRLLSHFGSSTYKTEAEANKRKITSFNIT